MKTQIYAAPAVKGLRNSVSLEILGDFQINNINNSILLIQTVLIN